MATSIQLLRSNIAQLRPDPATLAEGMPMVNLHESEPGLFFRLRDGTLAKVGPTSIGLTAPNVAATGYAGNTVGEQWIDITDPALPLLKVWDGTQWLIVSSPGGQGQKGSKGEAGLDGTDGAKGEKGAVGFGQKGQQGQKGQEGLKGQIADKGQKGGQSELLEFQGVVNTPGDLPATPTQVGDAFLVISTGTYHAWEGTSWYDIGVITAGQKGEDGQKGQKGEGIKGNTGVQGNPGQKGTAGAFTVGQKGQQGIQGVDGDKGDVGPKGTDGLKGEEGVKGEKGIEGAPSALPALYFRGNVATSALLPGGAAAGDTYYVIDQGTYYTWDGATPTPSWWNIGDISKGEKGQKGLDGNGTKGAKGEPSLVKGDAGTIQVGGTTTVASNLPANVTNTGTVTDAIFNFDIPKGEVGPKGLGGTVQVGNVTTVSSLQPAVITNTGTPSTAVLNFDIPKGEKGQKGQKGQKGLKGLKGIKGQKGATGNKGQKGEEGPVAGNQGEIIFNLDGVDPGSSPNLTWDNTNNILGTTNLEVSGGSATIRNSANQDGVVLEGRNGGTGDFEVTLTPEALSGDQLITFPDETGTLITTSSLDVVTSAMIVDNEIVNADINADAGIEISKLQDIPSSQFIIGGPTSDPTLVSMSGDATLSNSGQIDLIDDVNLGGDPTTTTQPTTDDSTKIATTAFVQLRLDEAIQGIDAKAEVVAATVGANITLSTVQTIDGVPLAVGDRVLVKDQTNPNDNGIYVVASGAWTRATDMDVFSEAVGAFVFSTGGAINSDSGFISQAIAGGTMGADPIPFSQFSGAGQIIAGNGMTKIGNQLDVNSADPTRIVVNGDDIDLATTAITAGTYRSVTVDTYGRAVGGTNPTTFAGYGLSDTSANLAAALTDETGSGSAVFSISPTFTGAPLAPTQLSGDNSTKLATTAYVDAALGANPLATGDVFVGNVAGVAVGVTMSGDATINQAGVVTIQPAVIDSNNIIDGTIATVDIGDNQITTAKILDSAVETDKIALGAVTSAKILDGTVATVDLADNAITTLKILDNNVTTAKLATGAVTSDKIADGGVATVDLADNAVSTAKILALNVTTAKLADAAVTSQKIADGTIQTADLADSSVTSAKIADGTIVNADLAANSVTTDNIVNGTIITADLADSSVTSDKIVDGTILNGDIANATVEGAKLVDNIALAGSPTTTTQSPGDNSLAIATTAYVDAAAAALPEAVWEYNAVSGHITPRLANRDVIPRADDSVSLGQPTLRWANIFTADMHFSNEGKSNDTDGTWGSWTLQEGENDIFFTNNRTGQTFKMVMQPV